MSGMQSGLARMAWGVALAVGMWAAPAGAEDRLLVVGSGEVAGLFYPEAGAVCRVVNKDGDKNGLRCVVEPTTGTSANIQALQSGQQQLAVVQSRILAQAVAGTGPFDKHPHPELRSLLSLHGEAVALVVGPNSKIKSGADLKGKRISLGAPNSFQHLMSQSLLEAVGVKPAELAAALEMDPARQVKALCSNELDGAVFTGLAPIAEVQEALDDCGGELMPIKGAAVDAYLSSHPGYVRETIGEEDYQGLKAAVPTIGLRSVLVATDKLSNQDAEAVTKAVFGNMMAFRGMHPMLSGLDKKTMARDGLSAPLHDGAQKFYKENGLP